MPITYNIVQNRKKKGETLTVEFIVRAIVHEAIDRRNFQHVEELYRELDMVLMAKRLFNKNYEYTPDEVNAYQRAISTIVRYALSPEKALEYAAIFFKDKGEPFRTPSKELIVLTNLIYVHKSRGGQKAMKEALELTKIALEIGVYSIDPKHYEDPHSTHEKFKDPITAFKNTTADVLSYFKLKLNSDKVGLVPQ